MVLVVPPEGWVLKEEPVVTPVKDPVAEKPPLPSKSGGSHVGRKTLPVATEIVNEKPAVIAPPVRLPVSAPAKVAAPPAAPQSATPPIVPKVTARRIGLQPVSPGESDLQPVSPGEATLQPASNGQSATIPVAVDAAPAARVAAAAVVPAIVPAAFTPFEQPEVVVGETFLSVLAKSSWGRLAVLAV